VTTLRAFGGGLVALVVGGPLALSLVAKRRGLRSPAGATAPSPPRASPAMHSLPPPDAIVADLWPPHAASPHDPASWPSFASTDDRPPFGDYQAHRWPYPSPGH